MATPSGSRLITEMMQSFRRDAFKKDGFKPIKNFQNPHGRTAKLSKQEQGIKFAKGLLTEGHHLQYKVSLGKLCTALSGSGTSSLKPHFTPSPLSSASLLASFLKHRLIRNQESVTSQTIRKIVGLADAKNSVWSHSTSQLARKVQFTQSLERLHLELERLKIRLDFNPENGAVRNEYLAMEAIIKKTESLINHLDPMVSGNLHPDSLLAGDKASMTPTEAALLPSPAGTIRGVLIRIKGPRKGNRAVKQQKSCGRVSINSVGYVNYEDCSLQLPSKLGIYGLYIRIVYNKTDRLISPYTSLPIFRSNGNNLKNLVL